MKAMPLRFVLLSFLLALPVVAQTAPAGRRPVLLVSIDGMRPDSVTHAEEHGLKLPTLRRLMREGSYAEGVQGVFPTVTYPSHTTLVTGVWPDEHGIVNNLRFDPERQLSSAWYWYASQIRVPTLFTAAHAAGLRTGSVSWPVTVDSDAIDFLIPEYWRTSSPSNAANPDDRLLMEAVSRPAGELKRMGQRIGTPYMKGNETTVAGDEIRTRYALDILREHRPDFMAVHLSSLDEEEHLHGPFSAEANADLEALDGMVGRLMAQELANDPGAAVAVVSDHGFGRVDHLVNLYVPFVKAGLMKGQTLADGEGATATWQAEPWLAGGLAAVMLAEDAGEVEATRPRVEAVLNQLREDPESGVEAVLSREEVRALGGFPDAAYAITLKPGYATGTAMTGALVTPMPGRGTHGYNPATDPEMQASFFVAGKGIAAGRDLGSIDMRQIAPAIATLLGVSLRADGLAALPISR